MLKKYLENVREKSPLIQCITNYVTINDVANALLALNASPIMADEPLEAKDIASISSGVCVNIGNLTPRTVEAMFLAGQTANSQNKPLILDPVGAGASEYRNKTCLDLIDRLKFDIIRGNASEIKALARLLDIKSGLDGASQSRGVDASVGDAIKDNNLDENIQLIQALSENTQSIIVVTGEIDLIGDNKSCYIVKNGKAQMASITGTGCQLSAVIAAFAAAGPENYLEASVAAVASFGLAGQIAWENMLPQDGNSTYRNRCIDALYNLDSKTLEQGALYELY